MMAGVVKMVVKNETSSKSLQVSSIKARLIDWLGSIKARMCLSTGYFKIS